MSSSWFKVGDHCRINGKVVTRLNSGQDYETAYGAQIASTGKHVWKIKIIKTNQIADYMVIGIASTTNHANDYFYHQKDPYNYGYYSDGRRMSKQVSYEAWPSQDNKVMYSEGDTITIDLDMDHGTLGFSKNGVFLGTAFDNVAQQQTYRLAVMQKKAVGKVEMVSYEWTNNNNNEEIKTDIEDTEESQVVKTWLRDTVRLPQYVDIFLENGFDDMMVIKELTIDDLKEMDPNNKIKIGHRKRILIFVRRLNSV